MIFSKLYQENHKKFHNVLTYMNRFLHKYTCATQIYYNWMSTDSQKMQRKSGILTCFS